ncbi:silicon efflux transporter LSI3-like isoform X4 [Prosopis cineraria]|uniref:silicon efflux transporter LSI3-like isoform X4 n=1 Tax=Prosopis cineraria TaxID=364024 RepID=UPI0024104803|nr:silicon efflux transporter LSI3-like isoform X4 [Prosopis cineraria]
MALASHPKVILGSFAFLIFWVLAVFPSLPFLPIGRTAGSLLGAMLMVIFQVLSPKQAYSAIDLEILGLLFGTMVVSAYLERADMFKYLGKLLSWKSKGAKDLLCRICLISAILSALFTNDTSCVVLTEFVLKVARQHNLPPHPFLLALASSANIGSSATPIGNPQNLVLSTHKDEEDVAVQVVAEEDVNSHRFSRATMTHLTSFTSQESNHLESAAVPDSPQLQSQRNSGSSNEVQWVSNNAVDSERNSNGLKDEMDGLNSQRREENSHSMAVEVAHRPSDTNFFEGNEYLNPKLKRVLWKACVYIITLGMLVALLLGMNMSWTAIIAALALIVLEFKDASTSLEKVSYSLLIFFCGMFMTVDGFNKTGIPSVFWDHMEPYSKVDSASGIAVLAIVILVLSNVVSNVPTVLLLGARIAASAAAISSEEEKKAWLILAWVSTVAGNLSLLGSAANLIVCEQARRIPDLAYNLTFWNHLKECKNHGPIYKNVISESLLSISSLNHGKEINQALQLPNHMTELVTRPVEIDETFKNVVYCGCHAYFSDVG